MRQVHKVHRLPNSDAFPVCFDLLTGIMHSPAAAQTCRARRPLHPATRCQTSNNKRLTSEITGRSHTDG